MFDFGTEVSNYSKLPHSFIGVLPQFETLAELKVVIYLLRHTWGFNEYDKPKHITTDEFMHGRKRADGSRMDGGTGLSNKSVIAGIRAAKDHGFIVELVNDSDKARIEKRYALYRGESGVEMLHTQNDSGVEMLHSSYVDITQRSEKETPDRNSSGLKERQMQASENSDPSPEAKTDQEPKTSVVEGIKLSVQLSEQQVLPHPPIAEAPPSQKPKKPLTNHQQIVGAVANKMGLGFAPSAKEVKLLKTAHTDKVTVEAVEAYFEWYAKEVPGFNFPRGKKFAEWFGKYLAVAPAPAVEGQSRYTNDGFELPQLGTKGD